MRAGECKKDQDEGASQDRRQDSWLWKWAPKHLGTFRKKKKKRQQQREQGADGEEGSFTPMAMPPQWRVSGSPTGKDHL